MEGSQKVEWSIGVVSKVMLVKLNLGRYLATLYVMIATVFVCLFADDQHQTIELQRERDNIRNQLAMLGSQIESQLNAPIQVARGLALNLGSEPDMSQSRFAWVARRAAAPLTGIRNIGAARDLVVNLVYPLEENQETLGLDYNQLPEQRDAVNHVRDTGEFILTGPVDLVQGGQAFIGRFPVFTERDGTQQFWGILSVALDLTTFYDMSGLTDPDMGLDLALIGTNEIGEAGAQFLGHPQVLADNPISVNVLFPNGSWELHARPTGGWGSTIHNTPFRYIVFIVGFAVVFLTALANHISLQRQDTIRKLRNRERQLEEARKEVEVLALHDHLTGLPNRRFLDRRLNQLQGTQYPGLILADLDGFKAINDTQGHLVGDKLLTEVARRLRIAAGKNAFVARNGGDEFVIICLAEGDQAASPIADRKRLEDMANELIKSVRLPFLVGGQKRLIGLSAGIHQMLPGTTESADECLRHADRAMYQAKKAGRNRHEFSCPKPTQYTNTQPSSDDLLEALSTGQIVPFYQPQFASDGETLIGVEALARWDHPLSGIRTPGKFMGLARDLKVESDLDLCIWKQAVSDLEEWDRAGFVVPQVSLNISFRTLSDAGLIETLNDIGIQPKRFAFELLEPINLDDGNVMPARNAEALKAKGFRIEIDDFGTGHSSVTSLIKLRPHCFKIDRSLVQASVTTKENRRLLMTIAEIGHALGIEVCAEGIETPEQLSFARAVGCTSFQGFLLAHPMSAAKLVDFLGNLSIENRQKLAG